MATARKHDSDRAISLLHRVSDSMEERLSAVFTQQILESFDCDDLRMAYGEWVSTNDALAKRWDRVNTIFCRSP